MNLLALFAFTVYAAETIVSPLPDTTPMTQIPKPAVSFQQLTDAVPQVLGVTSDATPTPTPARHTRKSHYTIALLGDSMIDTLGPDAPHLKDSLHAIYPATTWTMRNYGVGGTNIDYGIERLTHDYTYLGVGVPSLVSQHPDLVVIESFGYNPYSESVGALDKHWLALSTVVDIIKTQLPGTKIVIAATIAPDAKTFGDGASGLSFDAVAKQQKVTVIKSYLESTIKFAQGQHLPLADVYHPSLDGNGNGKEIYINGGDHIHYSDAGRALFAQKVTEAITANKLLE